MRASELLGLQQDWLDPGRRTIKVITKGTRVLEEVPASIDAFVWLALYQAEWIPRAGDHPVWWTLRRPRRPLTYHAARAVFVRANSALGTNYTLHDLRHTAAARIAGDPNFTLVDVQTILRHAQITTTQLYLRPRLEELIKKVVEHHARPPTEPMIGPDYDRDEVGRAAWNGSVTADDRSATASGSPHPGPLPVAPDSRLVRTGRRVRVLLGYDAGSPPPPRPTGDPGCGLGLLQPDELVAVAEERLKFWLSHNAAERRACLGALTGLLKWMGGYPGTRWEDRWLASGASPRAWSNHPDLRMSASSRRYLPRALEMLLVLRVLRPSYAFSSRDQVLRSVRRIRPCQRPADI